jgi:DNA-binding MarR family transcriptional regulator
MSEQFAPLPIQATADTRLGGPDFRLLGRIAYHDRLGRNGMGCFVDARKLAKEAEIHYKHLGRHADRLEAFGYLRITPSEADKRRKIYSVIYDEAEIVTCGGDNLSDNTSTADSPSTQPEIITARGDYRAEKVTKSKPHAVDPLAKSAPKRSSEAYLRDPAKPRVRNGENTARGDTRKPTNFARQGDRGDSKGRTQEHMMLPIQLGNQKPETRSGDPDWNGWAAWLQQDCGMTCQVAWQFLIDEQDRIATERCIDKIAAGAILDRELKKRRKASA